MKHPRSTDDDDLLTQHIKEAVAEVLHDELLHHLSRAVHDASTTATKDAAQEAVKATLTTLGFDPLDTHSTQADMLYLRNLRTGSEWIRARVLAGMLSVVAGALLWLMWEAFRHALHR